MIITELKDVLIKLGVKSGSIICISSDVTSFGIPAVVKEEVLKSGMGHLLQSYLETFQSVIGEDGLIIMPTFTYSACRGEVYDVQNSPSTVGAFTDWFRKQPGVVRSLHPIFSFAGWGKRAMDFLMLEDYDSFGTGSIFDKLYQANADYVLFGVDMQHGATYVYYSEQKHGVYYRYFKNFSAEIKNNDEIKKITAKYFVRDLNLGYKTYWTGAENAALKARVAKKEIFNGASVTVMKSQAIDGVIQSELDKNENCLIILPTQ